MPELRHLVTLTTGRQDYGIMRSSLLALRNHRSIRSEIWAGGMHLSPLFGETVNMIDADGLTVSRRLPFLREASDVAADSARALGTVGAALGEARPDALMLLGDRTETLAAAVAATIAGVPLVHLHGGEETEGAIDNACRHALTKLAHLHLVSHEVHGRRVAQMGEVADSIVVVGAGGIDNYYRDDLPDRPALERMLKLRLMDPVVLVTLHPTTLGGDPGAEARALTEAMGQVDASYVLTLPNADEGASAIREQFISWGKRRERVVVVEALGERNYWGLLKLAAAVLGNSSSGVLEAPATGTWTINVGDRQLGRMRYGRVLDVPADSAAIVAALVRALAEGRGEMPTDGYPQGPAWPRIVAALEAWDVPAPPRKRFVDVLVPHSAPERPHRVPARESGP